jgi:PHD/YefM family antitoxin component YafN of YafNO toxin-antitoxin module
VSVLRLAEVRERLPELVASVQAHRGRVGVARNGRVAAVLIAASELLALEETVAVLGDPPLLDALAAARKQVAEGSVMDETELAAAMRWRADFDPAG